MKKTSFTLTELVTVMLVITIVVTATLPITRKKFDKVDSAAYYMGYKMMTDISANAYPDVKDKIDKINKPCAFEINGECFLEPFYPMALSSSLCLSTRDKTGIRYCSSGDRWGGTKYQCIIEEEGEMAKEADIDAIARDLYNQEIETAWRVPTYATKNAVKDAKYGFVDLAGESYDVWFDYENSSASGAYRNYAPNSTEKSYGTRSHEPKLGLCRKKEQDPGLCKAIKDTYNIAEDNCDEPISSVRAAASTGDFSNLTPHIVLSNGLRIYIGSSMQETTLLSGEGTAEDDRSAMAVYIDVNGSSGKSRLYTDVFPFYLLYSGKVIPAYDTVSKSGANNNEHLSVNVIYDDYTTDLRQIKLLMRNSNFQSAACAIGLMKSPNYCQDKTQYDICKDKVHDCRMIVNEPIKVF